MGRDFPMKNKSLGFAVPLQFPVVTSDIKRFPGSSQAGGLGRYVPKGRHRRFPSKKVPRY